ncbi:DNA (cytosine-5-)-methyltransferase [Candidatus Peregrinibacteria bacterium]|nr:DNA (cytosine-5-)-methyltransferase [Candidatus Peregrinibacteria bacterium]
MNKNWIRKTRIDKNISQFKMAKALGITSQKLSAWELDKETPSSDELLQIYHFFDQPNLFFQKKGISLKKKTFNRNANIPKKKGVQNEVLEKFYNSHKYPQITTDKNMKAVMLFSGIGGMSLGFHLAGYNVVGHVEYNKSANKIYSLNFPESYSLGLDIKKVTDEQLDLFKKEQGEITVLAGGPPCQGFSLAGKRNVFDPRNELFKEFARFAKILKPKVIVLENVKMLLTMQTKDGGLVRDYLSEEFRKSGYELIYKDINAKEFGIPQSRERVLFIGLRSDLIKKHNLLFPESTHSNSSSNLFNQNLSPLNTFRNATRDLEQLESGEYSMSDPWHFAVHHPEHVIKMLRDVPEGKSAHENKDEKLRPTSGYNTTYKRIKWDEPSSTISTNFSMISGSRNVHPKNTRSLTIREAMRCQTFPDYFKLTGSLGEIRKGIGNAVPPKLAEFLANYIKTNLLGGKNNQP